MGVLYSLGMLVALVFIYSAVNGRREGSSHPLFAAMMALVLAPVWPVTLVVVGVLVLINRGQDGPTEASAGAASSANRSAAPTGSPTVNQATKGTATPLSGHWVLTCPGCRNQLQVPFGRNLWHDAICANCQTKVPQRLLCPPEQPRP